jgi:hypothetical protein
MLLLKKSGTQGKTRGTSLYLRLCTISKDQACENIRVPLTSLVLAISPPAEIYFLFIS